jgi:hypothetical protein
MRHPAALAWIACVLVAGAGCRQGGGDGDADADGDIDADADADADDDFDAALCEGTFPLGGECAPFGQRCCGSGERCTLVPTGTADGGLREACADETNEGRQGAPCAELGDEACGAGAWCFEHPMISFCALFCERSGDCPNDPMTTCDFIVESEAAYNVCTPAFTECDAVAGTGCPAGFACTLVLRAMNVLVACVPEGVHAAGADCTDGAGCAAGSGCYDLGDGTKMCLGYCTLEEICDDGQACIDIGHYAQGVCPPPAEA